MGIATITSTKTGQTFDVDFTHPPTVEDVDYATSLWETQFYQREGLDPSIAEQGVLGTAGNAFARDLGGVALDTVGGVAKGAAETKRALGPAGEVLRLMPGMSTVMSLGGAGDAVAGFTDAVRERGREVYPTNPANPVAETIGGGAGQAVAMLGTMGAAAPVMGTGAALTVVPSVLGGTMGLGSGIDTAKDMGIDNPAGRLALGAAFGGAEAITERLGGIGGKAAAKALQQGVRAGLKQAGKSVLSEAIEEPLSGTLQDAATFTAGQFVADPNRPGYTVTGMKLPALDAEFMQRRKMEAIGGAAGGAVFGGVQLAASGQPAPAAPVSKVPDLPVAEDLGELTAEDVADLEPGPEDLETGRRGDSEKLKPILSNVPDGVPTNFQSRPGTTDAEPGSSASSVPAPVAEVLPVPVTVPDVQSGLSDPGMVEGDVTQGLPVAVAAGSPVQRDATKPEQMTPEEVFAEEFARRVKIRTATEDEVKFPKPADKQARIDWVNGRKEYLWKAAVIGADIPSDWIRDMPSQEWALAAGYVKQGDVYVRRRTDRPPLFGISRSRAPMAEAEALESLEQAKQNADLFARQRHGNQVNEAVWVDNKPVSKAAVEAYGIKLPEGYTAQGDIYVRAAGATSADASAPAAAETSGLAGVQPAGKTGFKNLEPGGKSAGFVNGQILAEAEALIRQGFTDFANWSRAMVTRFGQAIRQYLQGIWQQVVAALPNDAAKNVRLGGAAKAGPVGLAQGGFVAGPEGQAMMVPKARTSVAQEASKPMAAAPPNLSGYEGEGTGNGWNREMNMSNNAVRALGLGRLMEADFKSWLADHLGVPESALTKSVLAAANQNAQNLYREYHHVGAKRDNVEFYNPDAVQLSPKFFLGVAKTVKGKANQERARRAALRSWQALRDSLSESGELGTWSFADEVVNTNGVLAQISTQLQTEVKAGRLPFQAAVQADLDAKTNDLVRKISQESDLIEGFKQAEAAFTDADKAAWLATNKNKMARSPWDKKAQQIKDATQRRQELQTKLDGIIADHPAMKMAAPVSRSGQVESNARLEGAAAPTKAEDVRVTNRATEATSSSAEISQQSSPEVNLQSKGFKNLEPGGKSAGFVNGQILAEAEALIREGFTDFANWSRAMVTRFGQAIRQYLQGIWEQVSAALPNDAAKNVRLGSSAKAAPVGLAQGGFVMGPNRVEETKARFARPEERERLYQVREDVTVKAAAEAWVDSMPMEQAVAAMEAGRLPADMTGDVAQHAAGLLIQRTTEMMKSNQEVVQMQARSLGHRISKVWQGWLSQEAGRNLRQRSVVNSELTPYAPILAAEGMLIDRADAVMDKRYEGGAEGAATKVNETAAAAGDEAGETLADDLEGETPERKAAKQQVRKQMAPAMKKLSKAQKTADRILQQLSERYADPPLMDANGLRKVDPVRALYKQHVQAPMSEADFVQQMMALGVPEGLAGTLWEASRLEIEARETLRLMAEAERAATKNAREIEVAENRASRLIYRTEERLRQGSKDLSRSTDGDSINKVFRDKVKDDIGWEAFRDRLAKLRVGEDIAARLWRTAERERIDQAAMVRFREERKAGEVRSGILAKGSQKLRQMLNDLRKKIAHDMTWADIFMELPASQKERQREIYRRLMLDERLKGLSKDERLALTNELDKAWQQERRKVFLRELERVGIGERATADKAKVVKALPKLIRLINLGMMNSEMFREAIAPEYGLKQITTGQALSLRKLAEEAYALPEGVLRSRKLAELLDGIQKSTGTGLPEVLNQYWVAAVLSGMRTQFDTFMSVTNGFGNQLIQSGMLAIKNGNRAAAVVSMMEWWRGLKQAFPEAMQILAKGDYSYLKRFNEDLKKALEGESTFRPVPLGEALWRDGNAMEKYGFAPVMIWTGRLMAAADHLNNSATTAGAKVVARALHPELYKTVAASPSEREAAAAQARREVTGGAMPATAPERATVAARTREILNGQLRPEELQEASFMGDQAAYQNDPTGVFGGIYRAVNQGLGSLERGLQAYAEERGADGPAGQYARGLMLFLSGAMRSMMGAKFIRFGANFGNDMLGYVPGTVLVSPALLGTEATRSQRQLLMGKNVFGLMAGLTVAAMFLGKDDEEEGWHMEGPWSDLTPEEVKQRRAAGFESLTFWKRTADKVERVSYKQWPTAGLLAGVAHMQDRQRFRPEKWAKEGMAGHLLAAATVGAFQVKDVSAMRGLADLLGASKFGANPEDALVEKMAKMPVNFAGGFIPTLVKDLDALADSRRYKPETVMEEFLRNVPLARRAVAGGRPEINILGVAIEQDRKPWSRAYTDAESGPAHAVLGSLSARGFTLPTPETNRKVWKDGAWSTIAAMGADAEWRYQKKVGEGYRAWLGSSEGRALLTMPDGLAVQKLINRQADTIKRQALQAVMK